MSEIKVYQYDNYGAEMYITPTMQRLIDAINDANIKGYNFCVGLVPAGYYATEVGIYGYAGPPINLAVAAKRPYFNENSETLMCKIILRDDFVNILPDIENMISQLHVSMGGRGNQMRPFTCIRKKLYEKKPETIYYCKCPGFDDIFRGLNILDPATYQTESDMLTWCIAHIDNNYRTKIFYYKTETLEYDDIVFATKNTRYDKIFWYDNYDFTLEIINTDIDRNFDLIVQILNKVSVYAKIDQVV